MINTKANNVLHGRLPLRAGLWLAQALLAGVYLATGLAVLFLPATTVLAIAPWAGHVPEAVLKFIGAVDLAAGLGLLLPSLTRIAPGLTVLAATCSALLQVLVIFSYALFGALGTEFPVNLAVFALSAFVAWGRSGAAPVASRWQDQRMAAIDAFGSDRSDESKGRPRARRRAMQRGRSLHGNKRFRIRRGVRGVPLHRARKAEPR